MEHELTSTRKLAKQVACSEGYIRLLIKRKLIAPDVTSDNGVFFMINRVPEIRELIKTNRKKK